MFFACKRLCNRALRTDRTRPGSTHIYHSAAYYDLLNQRKDYLAETEQIRQIFKNSGIADGASLLDVGCGSGEHLKHFKKHYECEGVDIDPDFVAIARQKLGIEVAQGDMCSFSLGKKFDVVTCLFAAIGYVDSETTLELAIRNMVSHLKPGGTLIIEPWYTPEKFLPKHTTILNAEDGHTKLTRMQVWNLTETGCCSETHILVSTNGSKVQHIAETHHLALFSTETQMNAMRKAGLEVAHDSHGFNGRGLFIGRLPS